ncbi:MAG: AMMECR1 domain-containing protein [Rhodocyclales bacterium GWA2_65_19]|nr:MAG: AMMECR1 domain-containing protein [Rhodocyclales bacterium GWA2_65_19]
MPELGATLLTLARNAIAARLGEAQSPADDCPELHKPGATFVTLTQQGNLRGCIGSLEAWRPLAQDVQENAIGAAFRDPRFEPLTADELPITRVEVSLLTPAEPIFFTSEADALAQLRPEIDGVILTAGQHRSTFLPQVWEQLPGPASFMAHLKQKAGLPANYWGTDVRLERYTVKKWKEATP